MVDRVETFDVTIPAGTLSTAPATTSLTFPDGVVESIEVLVPPGPRGLVGFRVLYGGGQALPRTTGAWLKADDDTLRYVLAGYPSGGRWSLVGYNTGVFDHTLQVRFLVDETPLRSQQPAGEVTPLVITPQVSEPVSEPLEEPPVEEPVVEEPV